MSPTYDYACTECHALFDVHIRYVDRDDYEKVGGCPDCGSIKLERQFPAPMVLKASYPDGTKRFTDMKEAAKLNREAANSMKQDTKKEIAREIRKLGVRVNKE